MNSKKLKSQFLKEGLKLSFEPYNLNLKHVFTVSGSSRSTTPIMLTKLNFSGFTGYGEASMPPYLGETQDSVDRFLTSLNLEQFTDPFRIEDILEYVDSVAQGNNAAKASVDIALHDLIGKIPGQPWCEIWGFSSENTPDTSFTIGIDTPDIVKHKVKEAAGFNILKVKLGTKYDKLLIETIRSVTDVPICVDVNQGWTDKTIAYEMINWLDENNVLFIEQPMPKEMKDEIAWLTQHSPLPIIADEAVKRLSDIDDSVGIYSGINIKLMKCTGMNEAYKMIQQARKNKMKVMIGCMTETSCAVSAAAQLSSQVDWADLDGNLLISNDLFKGVEIVNGKIRLNNLPGIGIEKI